MWSGNSAFQLLIITSGGRFSGLFVYSGSAPAHGNLIASVSASSGTDPFGNNYDAGIASYGGLNTAVLNASALQLFTGITERAVLSTSHFTVFNSHGATIYDVDLTRAAQFLYHDLGSASQGGLVASQSQNAGTDQFGNAYVAGVTGYGSPGGLAAVAQLVNGLLQTGTPGQIAGTGGAAAGQLGLISGVPGVVRIDSGLTATGDADAFLDVRSKNAQASISAVSQRNIAVAGPLALSSEGSTPTQLGTALVFDNGTGFAHIESAATGDTTSYAAGHAVTPNTGAVNLVQISFTNIFGGLTVAAANYLVEAHLIVTIGGTPTALTFQLTGPTVGANTSVKWWLTIEAGGGQSVFAGHSLGSLASVTLPAGTTVGAGGICHIWMSAYLQFTASGTLNLQGETSVALSGATVAIGSTLEVYPAS